MDLMQMLAAIPGAGWLLPYLAAAVAIAAALATVLPPPAVPARGWYSAVYHMVNWLALNVGRARNAADPTRKGAGGP